MRHFVKALVHQSETTENESESLNSKETETKLKR